jgi:hypothetical protein
MGNLNFMELAEKLSTGEISVTDKRIEKAEQLLAEMASTEDGRQEIAETVAIYLDKHWAKFDITPYICEYRNFKLGDKPEFRLKKKGIKAYWIAPNSSTPKSRNYRETLTMEFEHISVRPECLLDEIKSGRIQGFAELLKDAKEAVQNAIVGKVFTLLGQFYNAETNSDFFKVDTTTLAQASLNTAIDTIFYKTGKRPVIIGDMMLTNQIMGFEGFTEEANEEIRKTGKIGVYRGATILGLPEVKDEATQAVLVPKDRLYVVSSKIGYAGTYGDTKSGQESSIEDWSWNARLDRSFGMTVTDPKGMYVIEIQ